ncbi:MAG: UvrD-helicase domain-containing protein [Oscillospiraceae bacterium]|jgi:ATP-dependent helicase/nuclease subunit A|nr:UvrD-helicase domain-containing protein [Oscillospiraceae bacterium]
MDFTPEQLSAIEYSGEKLLISAAAGSGKTRVLVERITRLTERGASVGRFLVITFTRAAAAELQGRIADAFAARMYNAPPSERKVWLTRTRELYSAPITTIDAFCGQLLREFAHELNLRPDFRIIDDADTKLLQRGVLDDLLEDRYESDSAAFADLVNSFSAGRDDERLSTAVLEIYDKLQALPHPERWLSERVDAKPDPSVYVCFLLERAKDMTEYEIVQMRRALSLIRRDGKAAAAYYEGFSNTLSGLHMLSAAIDSGWDAAYEAYTKVEFKIGRLIGASDDAQSAKAIRDECKKTVTERLPRIFIGCLDELTADMELIHPAETEFYRLVLDFGKRYAAEKLRRNELDFADLPHYALKLLTDENGNFTEFARLIGARFDEVMADEFQDINGTQDLIFRALTANGTRLIAVGDIRQSIYRFRSADPGIFLKYLKSDDFDKVVLPCNFRSRPEILDTVNAIFTAIMSEKLGEIDYNGDALLIAGSKPPERLEPERTQFFALELNEGSRVEQEAAFVASEVRRLIANGALPGDIAILFRAPSGRAKVYADELLKLGIPVNFGKGENFFNRPDVLALRSILEVIDNPTRDIPLIAALRLFGFSSDELAMIRGLDNSVSFSAAFLNNSESDAKLKAFADVISTLRTLGADLPLDELLLKIDELTGFVEVFRAVSPDAEMVFARILEWAKDFEANGHKGLFAFLNRIRRLEDAGTPPVDTSPAQDAKAVTISSVHAAKGLEYNTVILADTASRFNRRDETAPLLWHEQFGAGPKLIDAERGVTYPTLPRLAIREKLQSETLSEETRILYVALTRAMERLYIVYASAKPADAEDLPIDPERLLRAVSPGEWLSMVFGGHAIPRSVPEDGETDTETAYPEAESERGEVEADEQLQTLLREYSRYVPSKLTATELKGNYLTEETGEFAEPLSASVSDKVFREPSFASPEQSGQLAATTAAARGNILHKALELVDFDAVRSATRKGFREHLSERFAAISATEEETAVALKNSDRLFEFFASPLGRRILGAEKVRREFKFSLLVSASEIVPGRGDGKILLQGVADVCFEEDGEIVLADYKSDRISVSEIAARTDFYRGQINAYALALSKVFGKPVKEAYICYIAIGRAERVSLAPAAPAVGGGEHG